ncbi:hypothetical protein LEMLEM_LOCUS1326, partial [Lemmus lemmus]
TGVRRPGHLPEGLLRCTTQQEATRKSKQWHQAPRPSCTAHYTSCGIQLLFSIPAEDIDLPELNIIIIREASSGNSWEQMQRPTAKR